MRLSLLLRLYCAVLLCTVPIFSTQSYAQEQAPVTLIKYQFTVQDVTDPASAKEMTDYIRPLFNTEEVPFGYFPWFNVSAKQFDFQSGILVTESQLSDELSHYGLVLMSFTAVASTAAANTSKE